MLKDQIMEYNGKIITLELLQEIEESQDVKNCIINGLSGLYLDKTWYTIVFINNEEIEVYI